MDYDTLALRVQGEGLFSRYDDLIEENHGPDLVTTGYCAPEDELEIIRKAIDLDMLVREATWKSIRSASYVPEPNFLIHLKKGQHLFNYK